MNPIVNVRLPQKLLDLIEPRMEAEGYTNMQELVKSLLREYALEKKREDLFALWGSQPDVKTLSRKKMRNLVGKEFD